MVQLAPVVIVGVPTPRAEPWERTLRSAGYQVIRIEASIPPGAVVGDAVVLGPEVPEGADVLDWVRAGPRGPTAGVAGLALSMGRADLSRATFTRLSGGEAQLTAHEVALLRALFAAGERVVPRDRLHADVWGHRVALVTRSVDNTVARLRSKIERDPARPDHLLTERGTGYRLVGAREDDAASASALVSAPAPVPLVGRAGLIARVRALLEEPGVVTLLGPPGVGKSALAAAALAGRDAVAATAPARAPMPPGPAIVLLDDVDDGVEAVARRVSELVDHGARVLVTARAPLAVQVERRVRVPPLDPTDAAQLLALRAGREDPAWPEAAAQLDGNPLALELAGRAARLMSGARLVERLQRPLDVLVGPDRRPVHHRSWRDAVLPSWRRLPQRVRACAAWAAQRTSFGLADTVGAVADAHSAITWLLDASLLDAERGTLWMPRLLRAAVLEFAELE